MIVGVDIHICNNKFMVACKGHALPSISIPYSGSKIELAALGNRTFMILAVVVTHLIYIKVKNQLYMQEP